MFRTVTALCLVLSGLAVAELDRTREQCTAWEDDCVGQRVVMGRTCPCPNVTTRPLAAAPVVAGFEPAVPVAALLRGADPSDGQEETHLQRVAMTLPPPSAVADTLVAPAAPDDSLRRHGAVGIPALWLGFALP